MTARDLMNEALKLPPKERGQLIRELIRSLDDEEAEDPELVERAWAAELEERAARVLAGEAEGPTLEEACDALDARRSKR